MHDRKKLEILTDLAIDELMSLSDEEVNSLVSDEDVRRMRRLFANVTEGIDNATEMLNRVVEAHRSNRG